MAISLDKLRNDDRFNGDNVVQFLAYLPFGIVLMLFRILLGLVLWVAAIILPNKSAVRQMLSTLACWTFGVYVKRKGSRDERCSVMVSNYVSCLDSLAASHVLGTISLRKWKVPPFFASTLGIRNAAQFIRKQHFAECPSKPVLLQPEGGPTNGKGLLKFSDWPFTIGNKIQPVALTVERPFTNVTVHRPTDTSDRFPWSDALWFLWTPVTVVTVLVLPVVSRAGDDDDAAYVAKIVKAIADALKVECTRYSWEECNRGRAPRRAEPADPERLARQVKEVLPYVPVEDILRDLTITKSVDVTITNFLEGVARYTPEPVPAEPGPSTSRPPPPPRYVTPVPTGTFPKSAKERQLSFQERKAQMIAEARQRYIEKHGLDIPVNC